MPWARVVADPAAGEQGRAHHGRHHQPGHVRELAGEQSWPGALEPAGLARLRGRFREHLLELDDADAARYAANSFTYTPAGGSESFLVMPAGLSERLLAQGRERGVTSICVDVSEFLKKGGNLYLPAAE